jgi:three-Cys-motif partner protein
MSNKLPTIWDADAHTIAKIAILKNYLNAWFPIVGSRYSGPIVYVDGFAGPGHYRDHSEGSPLAALRIFKSWMASNKQPLKVRSLYTVFIEADNDRFQVLSEQTAPYESDKSIHIIRYNKTFVNAMPLVMHSPDLLPAFRGEQPLLVFADPFGGTGIPFSIFEEFLQSPGSELLLNFDADGIVRIHAGKNSNWEKQLDDIFGGRYWEESLNAPGLSLTRKANRALKLYEERLSQIPGVNFVWSFEMRGITDRVNYYLIFATRNRLGMEKMKEAMRQLDQSGGYSFSDAHTEQDMLFREDSVDTFAKRLHSHFIGKKVKYDEIDRFALCDSPFTNPKSMLSHLSRADLVVVTPKANTNVRKHTFPEELIDYISFVEAKLRPTQGHLF